MVGIMSEPKTAGGVAFCLYGTFIGITWRAESPTRSSPYRSHSQQAIESLHASGLSLLFTILITVQYNLVLHLWNIFYWI